ncbi:MAG: Ig-like domain-containing protein, partial [Planctomycetes bacterium]|nr:Ig-like domain-containing protein [Planctomycetota bacterium]
MVGGEAITGFGVIVRDVFGNPMPGEEVELRVEEDRSGQVSQQTLTTGPDGVAQTSPMSLQGDTRGLSVTAWHKESPEVRDARAYAVAAPRRIELVTAYGVVRAGQAVGLTIRVLKDDGSVDEEFEGVVYLTVSNELDDQGRLRIMPVPFTLLDLGVRFVPDVLSFQVMGRRQVEASTSVVTLSDGWQTLGPPQGRSQGVTVLAGEPYRLVDVRLRTSDPSTSLGRAWGEAWLFDPYENYTFDVGVEFRFLLVAEVEDAQGEAETRTLEDSRVVAATDLYGHAAATGFPLTSDLARRLELDGLVVRGGYVRVVADVPEMMSDARRDLGLVAAGVQAVRDDPRTPLGARAALDSALAALAGSGSADDLIEQDAFAEGLGRIQEAAAALAQAEGQGAQLGGLRAGLARIAGLVTRGYGEAFEAYGFGAWDGVSLVEGPVGTVVPGRYNQPVATVLSATGVRVSPWVTRVDDALRMVVRVSLTLPQTRALDGSMAWTMSSTPAATLTTAPGYTWTPVQATPPESNPSMSPDRDRVEYLFISQESISAEEPPPVLDVAVTMGAFFLNVVDDERVDQLAAGEIRARVDIQDTGTPAERPLAVVEAVDIVTLRTKRGRFVFLQDPDEYLMAEAPGVGFDAGLPGGPAGVFQIRLRTPRPRGDLAAFVSSADEDGSSVLPGPMQVPLKAAGPNLYLSAPMIAVSDVRLYEEQRGAQVESGLTVRAQSAIPANGGARGEVQARLIREDGTAAAGATIVLRIEGLDEARLAQAGSDGAAEVTLTAGADGRVKAQAFSTRPGVARVTARTMLQVDADNAREVTAGTTVLFISDVLPVVAAPNGTVGASVQWSDPAQSLPPAAVAGVSMEVLPEGEAFGTWPAGGIMGMSDADLLTFLRAQDDLNAQPEGEKRARFRPLEFAIAKGLRPIVRFEFSDPWLFLQSLRQNFRPPEPPLRPDELLNRFLLEADDGDPAGTVDERARTFKMLGFGAETEQTVRILLDPDSPENLLLAQVVWQPAEGELHEGPMRFRLWLQGGRSIQGPSLGRNVGVVKCLFYENGSDYVEARWISDDLADL